MKIHGAALPVIVGAEEISYMLVKRSLQSNAALAFENKSHFYHHDKSR